MKNTQNKIKQCSISPNKQNNKTEENVQKLHARVFCTLKKTHLKLGWKGKIGSSILLFRSLSHTSK